MLPIYLPKQQKNNGEMPNERGCACCVQCVQQILIFFAFAALIHVDGNVAREGFAGNCSLMDTILCDHTLCGLRSVFKYTLVRKS